MGTCCSEWQRCLLLRGEKPQGQDPGDLSLASIWLLTGLKICFSPDGDKNGGWCPAGAQHLRMHPATCCTILGRGEGGEELIAQKKNNHQWLKVFHEPCLSCWQFGYNHSQHTALLLCVFICCQLPCSYFVSVLVGDSALVLCFHGPQTRGILWQGSWMLRGA